MSGYKHRLWWVIRVSPSNRVETTTAVDLPYDRDFHINWRDGRPDLHTVTFTVTRRDGTVLPYYPIQGNDEMGVIVTGAKIDIEGRLLSGRTGVALAGAIYYLDARPTG